MCPKPFSLGCCSVRGGRYGQAVAHWAQRAAGVATRRHRHRCGVAAGASPAIPSALLSYPPASGPRTVRRARPPCARSRECRRASGVSRCPEWSRRGSGRWMMPSRDHRAVRTRDRHSRPLPRQPHAAREFHQSAGLDRRRSQVQADQLPPGGPSADFSPVDRAHRDQTPLRRRAHPTPMTAVRHPNPNRTSGKGSLRRLLRRFRSCRRWRE